MFIDIHAHAYREPVAFVVQFCTAEELIRRYDEAGIDDKADFSRRQTNDNRRILDSKRESPGTVVGFIGKAAGITPAMPALTWWTVGLNLQPIH